MVIETQKSVVLGMPNYQQSLATGFFSFGEVNCHAFEASALELSTPRHSKLYKLSQGQCTPRDPQKQTNIALLLSVKKMNEV